VASDFIRVFGDDPHSGEKGHVLIHIRTITKIYPVWAVQEDGKLFGCTPDLDGAKVYFCHIEDSAGNRYSCGDSKEMQKLLGDEEFRRLRNEPTKPRDSPVCRPAATAEKYAPDPLLDEKEYEFTLSMLRSMSLVIERNPNSFQSLEEEAIRDHFLVQLNGHYKGSATGETFNRSGKTDILIRVHDRNIFIAECKFWDGQKKFGEAIDQLLGYLTWRDCKCALVIFNRSKDSAGVRQKMHEVMTQRPEYRKAVSSSIDGDSRYAYVKPSEPGHEITVSTQLFDVPRKQLI